MADHDLVILGAGAAGLSLAPIAAALGLRVALVERGPFGGRQLHAALPAAALFEAAREGWGAARARMQAARAAQAPNSTPQRLRAMGVEVIEGRGFFTAPDAIGAAGRTLRFRRAVVAAGAAPAIPPLPGLEATPFLTEDSLFDLAKPPDTLLVLGTEPLGLVVAQALARLGSRVSVLDPAPRFGADWDPELASGLRLALERDGIAVLDDAQPVAARAAGPGVVLSLAGGDRIEGTQLLLAAGRVPRVAGLDLGAAGVDATERGIAVTPGLRSVSNRRVFAAGSIADPGAGLGAAGAEHTGVLLRGLLLRQRARLDPALTLRQLGTDPAIVQVGPTEAELRAAGRNELRILRYPVADTGFAARLGRGDGLLKLVATPHGRLLGAGILAPGAESLAAPLALAIGRGLPLGALAGLPLLPGTLAEALQRSAAEFLAPKLLGNAVKRWVRFAARLP